MFSFTPDLTLLWIGEASQCEALGSNVGDLHHEIIGRGLKIMACLP